MKNLFILTTVMSGIISHYSYAQVLNQKDVPKNVQAGFAKIFPAANKVNWEKEKGNYEANWGGVSGEDSSAVFTPSSNFVEIVVAMPISQLPSKISVYVHKNYDHAKIKEASSVTDATGKHMFEVEIKGKDLIFDEKGDFLKED